MGFQPMSPIGIEAPPVSLLTVARRLPAGTVWRSGVAHLPNGCTPAENYPICGQPGYGDEKCFPRPNGRIEFESWPIYLPDGCDLAPHFEEDWQGRADAALEAYTPWAISRELDTGVTSGNPSLRSLAVDLTGAGSVPIRTGIEVLIRARVEQGFGGNALLHIPAWMLPHAENNTLLQQTGGVLTTAGGTLRVSPGPGYTGASPAGVPAGPGEGYIYISSMVEYDMSDIIHLVDPDEQQRRTNRVEIWAERFAIYRLDRCGVFAVLVNGG